MSSSVQRSELGYFGNIWVRQNLLKNAGDSTAGHKHRFDHVSLLAQGRVRVQVEGHEPKEFSAPTFIVIRKEHNHTFTALADGTIWYCVFALRDLDGEPISDLFDPSHHDPMSASAVPDNYWSRASALEARSTHEHEPHEFIANEAGSRLVNIVKGEP
jgi:hypothetical protein